MSTFSVGDKVIVKQDLATVDPGLGMYNKKITKGMIGTVCGFSKYGWPGVVFGSYIEGHTCGRRCERGYGWYIEEEFLELIEMDADKDDLALFMNSICDR